MKTVQPFNGVSDYLSGPGGNYVDPSQRVTAPVSQPSGNYGTPAPGYANYAGNATPATQRVSANRSAPITPSGPGVLPYFSPGLSGRDAMIKARIHSLIDQADFADNAPTGPISHTAGSLNATLTGPQMNNLLAAGPNKMNGSGNILSPLNDSPNSPTIVSNPNADKNANFNVRAEMPGRITPAASDQTIADRKAYSNGLRAQADELQRQADLHDQAEAAPGLRDAAITQSILHPPLAPAVQAAQIRAGATTQAAQARADSTAAARTQQQGQFDQNQTRLTNEAGDKKADAAAKTKISDDIKRFKFAAPSTDPNASESDRSGTAIAPAWIAAQNALKTKTGRIPTDADIANYMHGAEDAQGRFNQTWRQLVNGQASAPGNSQQAQPELNPNDPSIKVGSQGNGTFQLNTGSTVDENGKAIPRITGESDYNALKSGDKYYDPQGVFRVKQ